MNQTPRTPAEFHKKNHIGEFFGCPRCERALANCLKKQRFDTYEEADTMVYRINEKERYESPLVRYHCRWCLKWHMTTAKTKVRKKRIEKQRRKWMTEAELKLRSFGGRSNSIGEAT